MKILVVNAGSSSLKYQLFDMSDESVLAKGTVERIGMEGSQITHKGKEGKSVTLKEDFKNHTQALKKVLDCLCDKEYGVISDINEIGAVGHRVLHSGEDFDRSIIIDDETLAICKKNAPLGPLHMPANLSCIESCLNILKDKKNVAVFDTAFHLTMPKKAYMYAVPYEYYDKWKIRKYGFHGTSHRFVSGEALKYLKNSKAKVITCHLGNGASVAAVDGGKCVDTSMGLTPLEGLMMGTRSGDVDPAVLEFVMNKTKIDISQMLNILNKESGLKGISGVSSDMRDCKKASDEGNEKASLAIDMFAYRVRKYIGSYAAVMGGVDCIVMTGGVGENSHFIREKVLEGLEFMGVKFDKSKNENAERGKICEINKKFSKVKVLIIPTNEEIVIARDTLALVENGKI